METDYQLKALYRLPRGTLTYAEESEVLNWAERAGTDHFDTSRLMQKSRERITTLFHKHFEVR
jgi:hypothetical protein